MDDCIKGAATIEGLPKGEYFRIDRIGGWIVGLVYRSLAHGVSLCPRWAVEVVVNFQQDTPLFIYPSRTQLLTIPPIFAALGNFTQKTTQFSLVQ